MTHTLRTDPSVHVAAAAAPCVIHLGDVCGVEGVVRSGNDHRAFRLHDHRVMAAAACLSFSNIVSTAFLHPAFNQHEIVKVNEASIVAAKNGDDKRAAEPLGGGGGILLRFS